MRPSFHLSTDEWQFGFLISSVHSIQHLFTRLLPALIPVLLIQLDLPLWKLGVLVSVYLFTGGICQAPMGVVADVVDRRYLLVPAILLMALGYLVFAVAPSIGGIVPGVRLLGNSYSGVYLVMVLGMCVAGVGYSAIHPAGYPIISANVATENKGKLLGMWASGAKLGDTASPILVAVLVLVLSWEWILVCISGIGVFYAGFLAITLRGDRFDTRPPGRPNDAAPGHDGSEDDDKRPQFFLFPMGVMLLFFVCLLFTTNGLLTYLPVFVSDVYAYSFTLGSVHFQPDSVANFYFSVLLLSGAASQLVMGGLSDVFDYRSILVALLGLATLLITVLALLPLTPFALLLVTALVGGLIFGVYPARDALISEITPAAYEGRAFGYVLTFGMAIGAVYPALIGYMVGIIGIRASFAYLTAGTILGAGCILLLYSPRVYRRQQRNM